MTSFVLLNFLTFVLFGVALCNLMLGLVVLRRSRQEQHFSFARVAFFVALWTLANAFFRITVSLPVVTLWAQIAYVAALGTAAAFLQFAWSFPRHTGSITRRRVLWISALAIGALSFVPGVMIQSVNVDSRAITTAPGIYAIALFMLFTSGSAFSLFYHHQAALRGRRRAQARFVLYGSVLTAILGLFFNLLLPLLGNYGWVWLDPLSSLFFVGFSAYAIISQHLFNVRLLIQRTFVYSFLLAALAGSFAVMEKGMEHLILPLIGGDHSFSGDLVAVLLVGFAADPLKRWFRHVARNRLFQGEAEDQDYSAAQAK